MAGKSYLWHCPLITNEEHKKLSKRFPVILLTKICWNRDYLTEAIVNYVALLGWCPEDNQESSLLEELVKYFDYHHN